MYTFFYIKQTKKKSFKEEELPKSFLPKLSIKKSQHEEQSHEQGLASLRSTRGNSFSLNKERKSIEDPFPSMTRRNSIKLPSSSDNIEPRSPSSPLKPTSKGEIPM
jgi:hypothetical protein